MTDRHEDEPRDAVEGGGPYALAWSGGKDSTLALHRARLRGLEVTHLLNVYEGSSRRVRFHGVRRELIAAQAEALGLELVQEATWPAEGDAADEMADEGADEESQSGSRPDSVTDDPEIDREGCDFETAFLQGLERLRDAGVRGIVFGNIHLEDIREWYEERVTGRGLEHVEPLWRGNPARLVREFVNLGYRGRVVSVMLEAGDPGWLGRELDAELVEEILAREEVDPCGERGEFHSFVWDGPLFRRAVSVRAGETVEMEGHRLLDLVPEK